ncbi:putative chromatin regulator PHD family [Helianthus annuus]|nr:putative chromatin regulator PHD family [Helianthus annuus]
MDHGFKHFSHLHNLIMHQMPEGVEVSCSGCHSSATATVYVCWQCNFFLHEQCYQATRSLKHPSHPPHPLTLVPYPTYHSNSFYCNSCHIGGTGFSYSCADCEFDLHVQCAYSISGATSLKNAHPFQELVPQGWNGVQNSSIDHHVPFASVPESPPIPFASAQNHYMPLNTVSGHDLACGFIPPHNQNLTTSQDPFMAHNLASVSIPTSFQNPLDNAQYSSVDQTGPSVSIPPNYPPTTISSSHDPVLPQDRPSVSIPASSHDRISSAQYPSMAQTGPSVSVPTNYPPNAIPSSQDPSMPQDDPSVSIPMGSQNRISGVQYPSIAQTGPSVSIPTDYPQNPIPSAQDPSVSQNRPVSIPTSSYNSSAQYASVAQTGPSVSVPTGYPQNSIPSAQDPSTSQNRPVSIPTSSHNSSAQYPSVAQNGPSVSIPTNPSESISSSHDHSMPQNGPRDKEVMHFSHPHQLSRVNLQEDEENEVICSGCEDTLVGNGYKCVEPDCDFHLHESCFHLKREIIHKSHPEHPLTLLPLAPYDNKDGEYTCNACCSDGTGFTYHCSICTYDLHITCVSLAETVKRADHKHELKLFYSCPVKDEDFYCDVCHGEVQKDRWMYYCEPCQYGTHLGCWDCEECERDSLLDTQAHLLDTQAQLQRLQLQMQISRQSAQFIASCAASLASLV